MNPANEIPRRGHLVPPRSMSLNVIESPAVPVPG